MNAFVRMVERAIKRMKKGNMMNNKAKIILAAFIGAVIAAGIATAVAFAIANDSSPDSVDSTTIDEQAVSDGSLAESEMLSPKELQVTDFGYTVSDEGYVNFAVAIYNPNNYVEASEPVITLKVMNSDGDIINEESTTISAIKPNSTYEMSYVANKHADNNEIDKDSIADVAISVSVADESWTAYDSNDADITTEVNYAVAGQNVTSTDVDGVDVFQGQLAVLTDDGQAVNKLPDKVAETQTIPTYVNIILYGLDGKIAAGYYDVYDVPLNGDVIDFNVYAFNTPEYNGYKIFVHPYDYEINA